MVGYLFPQRRLRVEAGQACTGSKSQSMGCGVTRQTARVAPVQTGQTPFPTPWPYEHRLTNPARPKPVIPPRAPSCRNTRPTSQVAQYKIP